MCNDFGNHIAYEAYVRAFGELGLPVRFPAAAPNLEPRDDIWPTDAAPTVRALQDGTAEFVQLRWGFPSLRRKAPPAINLRSEGRRFATGRCLVPASHFFEFTGTRSPKAKWKFTKAGEEWFCFAGLWCPAPDGSGHFALLTTAPGPDIMAIHDRQVAILERDDWAAWLRGAGNEQQLLRPLPAGSLHVEQVR